MRHRFLSAIVFCLISGTLLSVDLVHFDQIQLRLLGPQLPGLNQVSLTVVPPRDDAANGMLSMKWGDPPPTTIAFTLTSPSEKMEAFMQAEVSVNVEFPETIRLRRIVLRLIDAKGETFQFANNRKGVFPKGKMKLTYLISDQTTTNSWNGDGKFDWPLRLGGIAVDLDKQTAPNGNILLDSVEYQLVGEYGQVEFRTGAFLNLLPPDGRKKPELVVRNIGTLPLNLTGTLTVSEFGGPERSEPLTLAVPVGATFAYPIPGDNSRQGCWELSYRLQNSSQKAYSGKHRFARMNPAGPTKGVSDGFLFGLCSHMGHFSPEIVENEARAAGLCGAKIIRIDFIWSWIQAQTGEWNHAKYDHIVDACERNGVEVLCLLNQCPPWAADRTRKGNPPELKKYSLLAETLAARYRGRIRYFEIWNEPDHTHFAAFPGEEFMELLRHSYDAIKKVSPDAQVMNGGIANVFHNNSGSPDNNNGILEMMLADGGKHFDLFAYHGHGPLDTYRNQLDVLETIGIIGPRAPRPWYSNETAESSAGEVGEMGQAESVFKKLLTAWTRGAVGYNWYLLREKDHFPAGNPERHFGLITGNFEPKPGYVAYNMLASTYQGGEFVKSLPLEKGITSLLFRNKAGEELLALWSDTRERFLFLAGIPAGTVQIDLFGNEVPVQSRNGVAGLRIEARPFTLKMPAGTSTAIRLAGELLVRPASSLLQLVPGETLELTLPLNNPTGQALKLKLEAESPSKLAAIPKQSELTLLPGKIRTAVVRLTAPPEYDTPFTSPDSLRLILEPEGMPKATLDFSLVRKRNAKEPLFILDRANQYFSCSAKEHAAWRNPQDLSAKVWLTREGENLRLKVTVDDDRHVQPTSGPMVWSGDNIQFELQLPGRNRTWRLGLTRLADGKSEVCQWNCPPGLASPVGAIQLTTRRDEVAKQTFYDALIPFAVIGMTPEIAAEGFRFNFMINDNDGLGRKGYLEAKIVVSLD